MKRGSTVSIETVTGWVFGFDSRKGQEYLASSARVSRHWDQPGAQSNFGLW